MSLCNQILDVADDLDKSLLKEILKETPPPDVVKTANIATRESQEKLSRSSFALVAFTKEGSELRKYPINDAANTWLSCRYFEKTAHKLTPKSREIAAYMLKRACQLHGVAETSLIKSAQIRTSNVYHENYDMTKVAHTIQVEATTPDGSENFYALGSRYAMPNPEYVKKAAAYFVDFEKSFTDAADRHQFADRVIKRASELKVDLDQTKVLSKYASSDYGDILDIQIKLRQELLQSKPEMSAALEKVASEKARMPAPEFAKLLHAFDKRASIERYYGGYIADAFKATFEERMTKSASGYSYEGEEDGLSCTEKELNKAFENKHDSIKGYFGPTIADQLKKHGCAIFESLPRDAKSTIAMIVKGKI